MRRYSLDCSVEHDWPSIREAQSLILIVEKISTLTGWERGSGAELVCARQMLSFVSGAPFQDQIAGHAGARL